MWTAVMENDFLNSNCSLTNWTMTITKMKVYPSNLCGAICNLFLSLCYNVTVLFSRYFFCSFFILWKSILLLEIQLILAGIYWAPSNVPNIMLEAVRKTDEVYAIPLPSKSTGFKQETICMQIIQLAWKPTECKYGKVENKISQLDKNYAPDTLEH